MFSQPKKSLTRILPFHLPPKLRLTPEQCQKATVAVTSVLALTAILWVRLPNQTLSLKEGDTALEDVRAPRTTWILDHAETRRRREKEAEKVPPHYLGIDPSVKETALQRARQTFEVMTAFNQRYPSASERRQRLAELQNKLADLRLPDDVLMTCLSAQTNTIRQLSQVTQDIIASLYKEQIRDNTDDLTFARQRAELKAAQTSFPPPQQNVIRQVVHRVLTRPNSQYSAELTEQAKQQARRSVQPVFRPVVKGEIIVHRGDPITAETMQKLTALGLMSQAWDWSSLLALFGLALFFVTAVGIYVYQHAPKVAQEARLLSLLALVPLVMLLVYKIGCCFPGLEFFLAVPMCAITAMLITILLDSQLAMAVALSISILTAVMSHGELPLCLMSLGSAIVGVYCVSYIASRKQLVKTGFALAGTNVFLSIVVGALYGTPIAEVLLNSAWGVGNGIASVIIALGAVMFLERPFGVMTHLRLLELSDPSEPILRQMQMEAPGTATHSILVGNLAESAAKAIGADALLCRVSCLYHDIGKLRRPYCFAENQFGGENIHDRINPTLSALAVIAHVKDGIEMARQLKLPQPIIDIIPQHHGTTLASFFYQRALEVQADSEISEASFRYPGPKPQTKEAAIVMLADSVEAAARTLAKPTPHRIEHLVRAIITSRLEDGQLNECDLTLIELERIAQSFAHVLQGLLHSRVEYPDSPWSENKSDARGSGSAGALPAPAQRVGALRGLRRIAGRRH
jgi:hypothetical protein